MVVFYFSATGNSKYVAELFCENMNVDCHSIEEDADFNLLITQNDTVGFCYPELLTGEWHYDENQCIANT